ncbi:MAG: hypothetical protein AB7F43_05395 [Bacteriovoracia bacterium]
MKFAILHRGHNHVLTDHQRRAVVRGIIELLVLLCIIFSTRAEAMQYLEKIESLNSMELLRNDLKSTAIIVDQAKTSQTVIEPKWIPSSAKLTK